MKSYVTFICFQVKKILEIKTKTILNPLPDDKTLNWSKLKAFTDNKINVTENLKSVLERVENIVGKGENAGYQHFLLFPTVFSKAFFLRIVKSRDCVVKN